MLVENIINCPSKKINIVGVPGSGKTQLVCDVAKYTPKSSFLYLSFGRENTKNARRRMPQNVFCSSFHSLSKNKLGIAGNRITSKFTMSDANKALMAHGKPLKSAKMLEAFVILCELFCISGSPLSGIPQILLFKKNVFPLLSKEEKTELDMTFRSYWRSLWESGSAAPVTHDMYLKQYALVASPLTADYLVIDETQDLNAAMFSLVGQLSAQNPLLKIIKLGDPCQQIFSFIGSSEHFSNETFHFTLDGSHRFGEEVASLSNRFMEAQGVTYYTPIKSLSASSSVNKAVPIQSLVSKVEQGFRPTVLARHNMTLWYMLKQFASAGISCAFNGDTMHELNFLEALYQLSLGNKPRHAKLRGKSYSRLSKQAKLEQDNATMLACRFVDSIKGDGHAFFSELKKFLVPKKQAQVLLSTVHQAKGLEFSHVVMMDDFPSCWDQSKKTFLPIEREEAHIIYTAITRTKKSLTLPKSWASL